MTSKPTEREITEILRYSKMALIEQIMILEDQLSAIRSRSDIASEVGNGIFSLFGGSKQHQAETHSWFDVPANYVRSQNCLRTVQREKLSSKADMETIKRSLDHDVVRQIHGLSTLLFGYKGSPTLIAAVIVKIGLIRFFRLESSSP